MGPSRENPDEMEEIWRGFNERITFASGSSYQDTQESGLDCDPARKQLTDFITPIEDGVEGQNK